MESIAEKIRIQRLIRCYSQEYMAFAMEMSQAAYSNIESGKTNLSLKRIYEIAEILQISPFELMPRPKYGTSINVHSFRKTLLKVGKFFQQHIRKRQREAEAQGLLTGTYQKS